MTTDAAAPPAKGGPKPPGSRLPLFLGLGLAILGGAGGFWVVRSGLLPFGGAAEHAAPAADGHAAEDEGGHAPAIRPAGFVELPPLVVNMPGGNDRLLRFVAQLEVAPEHLEEVTALIPRVADVLNGYLRAVTPEEVEDPAGLMRLRAQMLRRVQVVAGGDRVRDLLVMELVVN